MTNDDYDGTEDYNERVWRDEDERRRVVRKVSAERPKKDTGRFANGYRVFRDGSYREDFGSDR